MSEDHTQAIAELGEKISNKDKLRARLTDLEDQIMREGSRGQMLETHLEMIQREVHKLENGGLLGSLFSSNRVEKLDAKRDELSAKQQEYVSSNAQLEALEKELDDIKHTLDHFDELEAEYKALCEQQRQYIAQDNPDQAEEIAELETELDALKDNVGCVSRAIDAAEEVLRSADAMTSALINVDRQKNKVGVRGHGNIAGAIIAAAVNTGVEAIIEKGSQPAVRYARQALERLLSKLADVSWDQEASGDEHVLGLIPSLGHLHAIMDDDWAVANVGNAGAGQEIEHEVRDLLQHLKAKHGLLQERIEDTEGLRMNMLGHSSS